MADSDEPRPLSEDDIQYARTREDTLREALGEAKAILEETANRPRDENVSMTVDSLQRQAGALLMMYKVMSERIHGVLAETTSDTGDQGPGCDYPGPVTGDISPPLNLVDTGDWFGD